MLIYVIDQFRFLFVKEYTVEIRSWGKGGGVIVESL